MIKLSNTQLIAIETAVYALVKVGILERDCFLRLRDILRGSVEIKQK